MRKRSGALHSDSEQEFLILAQLAHEKTGYFYDETLHSTVNKQMEAKRLSSPKKQEKPSHFAGFDFSVEDTEKREEQEELSTEIKTASFNIVILCDNSVDIKSVLWSLWPNKKQKEGESPFSREFDLYIAKVQDLKEKHYCFKFWVLELSQMKNRLYQSYLKKADRLINFSSDSQVSPQHPLLAAKEIITELVASLQL